MTIHTNIGGVEKQGTEVWCNINGVWKKAEKLMVNVDGVWKDGGLERLLSYIGAITTISTARMGMGTGTIGNHALFAGGESGSSVTSNVVDAYDTSLIKTTPTALGQSRRLLASANVGDYLLFAGGRASNNVAYSNVDAYNLSLVRTNTASLSVARYSLGGASVGNYAVFAGGYGGGYSATADAYNTSLVRSTPTVLSVYRNEVTGASSPNHAVFAGGIDGSEDVYVNTVDAYNTSLIRSTPTSIQNPGGQRTGAKLNSYAFFAGGWGGSGDTPRVTAYDSNLTRIVASDMTTALSQLASVSFGDIVLVGGGKTSNVAKNVVNIYDDSLVRSLPSSNLTTSRINPGGARAGNYAIFAGGRTGSSTFTSTANAYLYQ